MNITEMDDLIGAFTIEKCDVSSIIYADHFWPPYRYVTSQDFILTIHYSTIPLRYITRFYPYDTLQYNTLPLLYAHDLEPAIPAVAELA